MQRSSVKFEIDGVDGGKSSFVARSDLISVFAGMAQSDLLRAHSALLPALTPHISSNTYYIDMPVAELLGLLEIHTRAANALSALMALRHPDELVEAHMPRYPGNE